MPTYTFRCPKCGYKFMDVLPMKDSGGEKLVCLKCGNKGLSQVFEGSFSIISKNSNCLTGACPLTRK